MLKPLSDIAAFRRDRANAWSEASDYWLKGDLRQVTDVGDEIVSRVLDSLPLASGDEPLLVDVGCGEGWLGRRILDAAPTVRYVGLDSNERFVSELQKRHANSTRAEFLVYDVEERSSIGVTRGSADVVANCFNFFELADLETAMENSAAMLRVGGTLLIATIDEFSLILAGSKTLEDYRSNLADYQNIPGVKYYFQPIDLGQGESKALKYASVLYSLPDYLSSAHGVGLVLDSYTEVVRTARPIPKVYRLLSFKKQSR